jgi:HEAT repeat protein
MRRVAATLPLLLAGLISAADASRAYMPMGYYVRQAGLIVVADTQKGGERGYDTVLSVKEVLQGDPKWLGKPIVLHRLIMSTADAGVPVEAKGVAVLLQPKWQQAERWPVLEAYEKPHELEALRLLVKIYEKPDERKRLVALREVFAEGNPVLREQLFADFRDMKNPENFHLMTELYPSVDPANQRKLVDLLAGMGDLRGVPTLIQAMFSSDRELSAAAASRLYWTFPGAPGVTEAFEKALDREHLSGTAARYLVRRRPDPELEALIESEKTPWRRAESLRESGDDEAAKALYLQVIQDESANDYRRRWSATRIVHQASPEEKQRIRAALLPLLAKDAETDNWINAREAAGILRGLEHPDCLEPLLRLTQWSPSHYRTSVQVATMGIRDLGREARRKAAAQLIEKLESAGDRAVRGENTMRDLLELVWLGDQHDLEKARQVMPARYRASWETLRPLWALDEQEDEGAFLLERLRSDRNLPVEARLWIVFRLGDLRDRRAVEPLARCLVEELDWRLDRTASEALVKIGGPQVEEEMIALLIHEDHNRVRRHAIETLFPVQGERSLALSRRMLSEEDFGLKGMACSNLAHLGTPDDLKLLLPLCDYWTADRKIHHLAMSAVAMIRDRHNYDINGPIVRPEGKL